MKKSLIIRIVSIIAMLAIVVCGVVFIFSNKNKQADATSVSTTTTTTTTTTKAKAEETTSKNTDSKEKATNNNTSTTKKSSTTTTTAHVHTYTTFVKTVAPTATEQGYDVYQCSCGAQTKTNYKAATGQSYPTEADAIALKAALRAYGEQNGLTWNSNYNEDSFGVNYDTTMTSLTSQKTYEWSYNKGCEYLEYACLPYSCREFDGGYDIFNIEYWPSGSGYMFRCYFGFSELL